MVTPKISVIIPVYNTEPFLNSVIKSVLNQTVPPYEIILVDDGSTDDSLKLMNDFKDEKIKIISIENRGCGAARNVGIRESHGDIIALIDSDDLWEANKLEIFNEQFVIHPDIEFAFSDLNRFEWSTRQFHALSSSQIFPMIYSKINQARYQKNKVFRISKYDMFVLLLNGYPIYPSTMVFRKSILEKAGLFDEKKNYQEDMDFSLRCSKFTDFIYIDHQLTNIGRHTSNVTYDYVNWDVNALKVYDQLLGSDLFDKQEKKTILFHKGRRMCSIARSQLNGHNYVNAFRLFMAGLKNPAVMFKAGIWLFLLPVIFLINSTKSIKRMTAPSH